VELFAFLVDGAAKSQPQRPLVATHERGDLNMRRRPGLWVGLTASWRSMPTAMGLDYQAFPTKFGLTRKRIFRNRDKD
jgi:hypothetical protein